MDKTICELFAGVGGFRLGFERLNTGWRTTWFSQWEPGAKTQWAHDCYVSHFGDSQDLKGEFHTGEDISLMEKKNIPDHNLLVGGFPCQDYSVAHTLASSKGIEGKKGVLWWQIRDTIIAKKPGFCIFENVDRLLKSPASQRGRDFGIILACLADLNYSVEWRVVNAATYGASQRRRRTFIFAYKNSTEYGKRMAGIKPEKLIASEGFMAKSFPITTINENASTKLFKDIVEVSDTFSFPFMNAGYMTKGAIYTFDVTEKEERPIPLKEILQSDVNKEFYISEEKMPKWVYLKGAKKIPRRSASGHEYIFSEGPVAFPDPWDRPGRTMLTSESTVNRSTHVVTDPGNGRLRILTPVEAERLQGFDDDWTNSGMPQRMRFFCMGNALVVPMVTRMGKVLDRIFAAEDKEMSEHIYDKSDLIGRFESILELTLEEIDNKNFFDQMKTKGYSLQKGVAGSLIEQCVLGYAPDSKQEADLIVRDGENEIRTELKTTGMVISEKPAKHFVAKEPMSITAVGIYDIADQTFETSHFWEKLQHMLIVYYHYTSDHPVKAYEYKEFPVKGYEFHEFDESEVEALRQDWENVRSLAERIIDHHPGERDKEWKEIVKQEYIDTHGELRRILNYVDLAPKFPPRFRLKKPIVSSIVGKHFGYQLEQLPGRYSTISDIDRKCRELTEQYSGETVESLARRFHISTVSKSGAEKKGVAENIVTAMFGGTSKKIDQIEIFEKFGLVAKTIVMTSTGGRTEDMKLFHVDFDEIVQQDILEEDGTVREFGFEDSELYSYFADHEMLCIVFEEPDLSEMESEKGGKPGSLAANRFIGFKRLLFSDELIDKTVRRLWEDIRDKVINNKLIDVVQCDPDGSPKVNKSGDISSAPNFLKSKDNDVFLRGSGADSALVHKTECVNGIKMLPQYVWIKGTVIIDELSNTEYL